MLLFINNIYKNIFAFKDVFNLLEVRVDVFPNISLKEINNYKIDVQENLTINSPLPQNLTKIFNSNQVKFSPRLSYLYLSEEGKNYFNLIL